MRRLHRQYAGGPIGRYAVAAGAAILLALAAAGCGTAPRARPGPVNGTGQTQAPHASGVGVLAAPSASAGPSPTADRSPGASRQNRTGKPGSGNTGVPPGTRLTVVTGNHTYATDNAVISGKDFHGFVTVTGRNITFRNCIFRGGTVTGNAALLNAENGTNTVVEDSEFAPANPAATLDDIWTNHTSIYRANIHGGVDGVKTGSGVLIQDSYIHDMTWFASDPNQGGGETHNDGVQTFLGDSGVTLVHNTIDMSTTKNGNAALQDSATAVRVVDNWLDGGGCTLNFADLGHGLTDLSVTNNRFGRHSFYRCPILLSTGASLRQNSGNVWSDTGAPIPPPQQHN